MKRIVSLLIAVATAAGIVSFTRPLSGDTDREASPIYGITIPAGYREWKLISVSEIAAGDYSQLRAEFGNNIAIKAFQEGKLPFPDGTIIAAQHWTKESSPENDKVLAKQVTRRCTKHVSPAISQPKIATTSSRVMHLNTNKGCCSEKP